MNFLVTFMATAAGRLIRIVAGLGLIGWGLAGVGGSDGYLIAAIGALPLFTGLMNICLIAPLLGGPVSGAKTRAASE